MLAPSYKALHNALQIWVLDRWTNSVLSAPTLEPQPDASCQRTWKHSILRNKLSAREESLTGCIDSGEAVVFGCRNDATISSLNSTCSGRLARSICPAFLYTLKRRVEIPDSDAPATRSPLSSLREASARERNHADGRTTTRAARLADPD